MYYSLIWSDIIIWNHLLDNWGLKGNNEPIGQFSEVKPKREDLGTEYI